MSKKGEKTSKPLRKNLKISHKKGDFLSSLKELRFISAWTLYNYFWHWAPGVWENNLTGCAFMELLKGGIQLFFSILVRIKWNIRYGLEKIWSYSERTFSLIQRLKTTNLALFRNSNITTTNSINVSVSFRGAGSCQLWTVTIAVSLCQSSC